MPEGGAGGGAGRLGAVVRSGAEVALRARVLQGVAVAHAGSQGRGLALLWHRIGPAGPADHEVVRTVGLPDFERQLDLLAELGDVVGLAALERPRGRGRPRFALTFDDDDRGHVESTLPALRARRMPATFFLSGRWQTGRRPYWWEVLEGEVRRHGAPFVARSLGLPAELSPPRIAAAITGTPHAGALAARADPREDGMTGEDARSLADAGMEIGFHTRDHDVLPLLDDHDLHRVLTEGRHELGDELGVAIDRFAYPHGRADPRVAEAAARAGFVSAWTTTKARATTEDHPMLRGRWDLGGLGAAGLRSRVLRALVRPRP